MREVIVGAAAAALLLVALPALSWGLRALQPMPVLPTASAARPAPWTAASPQGPSSWRPILPGATEREQLTYVSSAAGTVEAFRASYRAMRQDAKLFGSRVSVAGRRLKPGSEQVIDTPAGRYREEEVVDRTGARSIIWWRYEIAGRDFVVPLAAQLWYGVRATVSNPSASLIAYRAECRAEASCMSARRALGAFVANVPTLRTDHAG